MGKWKAIVPFAFALVIAVAGSFFLYKWIKIQTAPKEVVQVKSEAIPVAVAAVDLPWGTKIRSDMLKTVPYLKESIPNGSFHDTGRLNNRVVISPIKVGEPIIEHRLAPESITTGGVSAVVPAGKRAIAVKGDKVIGLSGHILPSNRVDVLVTLPDPRTKKQITKTVLENILVLATGTQIQENDQGKPAPVDVYTLEVTPEEAERLSLAAAKGKLNFALRNHTDDETVLTQGETIPKMLTAYRGYQPKPEAKKVKAAPKRVWPVKKSVTVEVIKGSTVNKVKIKS